ncbi:Nitrogen regulatory protein [Legionella massiliensis]|uniref:Nitrogen regulatory protein n=1 Tax=Legionella massiliensis TaxID=1034943 RepID=A0A078KQR8_9GAMM|nr:PTS sugar transporter subunit IIA [Legionella massiliensis]CDZ76755.1 Nitrogen regulatory protein [Legionella massiliensis]CEE12493.1 Nitrogen regulatory protein [Legionella massiliensis]
MQLSHIINLNAVYIDSVSKSKTAVLLKISQILSQLHPGLNEQELFEAYWKRECLGSTAIGQGITIPHIRSLKLEKAQACIIRLLNPVDFGAADKQPIDLAIGLVVPQEQVNHHLEILAAIIKRCSVPSFREACRRTDNNVALYNLLITEDTHQEELA